MTMGHNIITEILASGGDRVSITVSVADLVAFANAIATNVANSVINGAVEAISGAMGDNMTYCTRKETMALLKCSSSTLARWEKQNLISSSKMGGKNLYLRSDVLAMAKKDA